ncbi:MAG: hypothetical protein R3B97_15300 [Dehalococcoidia bacterium]|nr:hypothetical protein [Dehalococcoidia bacterium]
MRQRARYKESSSTAAHFVSTPAINLAATAGYQSNEIQVAMQAAVATVR